MNTILFIIHNKFYVATTKSESHFSLFWCIYRCVTRSWWGRRGASQQVSASEGPGAAQAASPRVAWAPEGVPGGPATPSPIRKALESWLPQEKTWGSPPWPSPILPPNTAPAGSKRFAGRKTIPLHRARLESAARHPVTCLGSVRLCQTLLLFWEAHKKHQSRRKLAQQLSCLHCHIQQPRNQLSLGPLLRSLLLTALRLLQPGQTHLEAGHALWRLCRSAAFSLKQNRVVHFCMLTILWLL